MFDITKISEKLICNKHEQNQNNETRKNSSALLKQPAIQNSIGHDNVCTNRILYSVCYIFKKSLCNGRKTWFFSVFLSVYIAPEIWSLFDTKCNLCSGNYRSYSTLIGFFYIIFSAYNNNNKWNAVDRNDLFQLKYEQGKFCTVSELQFIRIFSKFWINCC